MQPIQRKIICMTICFIQVMPGYSGIYLVVENSHSSTIKYQTTEQRFELTAKKQLNHQIVGNASIEKMMAVIRNVMTFGYPHYANECLWTDMDMDMDVDTALNVDAMLANFSIIIFNSAIVQSCVNQYENVHKLFEDYKLYSNFQAVIGDWRTSNEMKMFLFQTISLHEFIISYTDILFIC